jgi:hypothetical protein
MKSKHITMIGHGTNGSDKIEEGIHLRWGFNEKPGFPYCFTQRHGETDVRNKHEFKRKWLAFEKSN